MLCGNAQGLIFPLEQVNAAGCDGFFQCDGVNAGKLRRTVEHFPGNKPDAEITADNRRDLIDGFDFHIRAKRQLAAEKEPRIKIVGGGSRRKAHNGILRELGKRYRPLRQFGKGSSADRNLLNFSHPLLFK